MRNFLFYTVQKSGPAKLAQLAHHGRILIKELILLHYPLDSVALILKKIMFEKIICEMPARISSDTRAAM